MQKEEVKAIWERYKDGKASAEDVALLESWYLDYEHTGRAELSEEEYQERLLIVGRNLPLMRKTTKLWPRIVAISPAWKIAAAVAAITLGTWLYYASFISGRHPDAGQDPNAVATIQDIAPGRNTATLTLANGKTINLSDVKTGVTIDASTLTYTDGTVVDPSLREGTTKQSHQDSEDEIASSRSASRNDGKVQTLVMSTPRGGTYQVVLPDGTEVWLNADSKIMFPSQFTGAKRQISLEGEAYFQVAKDKAHPFIVQSKGQEVTVLGTHFNINAYPDEGNTKTTLIEGSVRVSYVPRLRLTSSRGTTLSSRGTAKDLGPTGLGMIPQTSSMAFRQTALRSLQSRDDKSVRDDGKMPESIVLKPSQQTSLNGETFSIKSIDPASAIDWKNGEFVSENENLASIMRKVSRWYNVEVVYASEELKKRTFDGSLSRYDNVSRILKAIEFAGAVKFKVEGRMITVLKN